jgi:thymidylate synthase (FAD)
MAHAHVPEAEEILDKEFPVLDKGFIRLVDYLGSDARIVQSARVSYGEGTKSFREDKGLINYLLRNDHTSPFEQVVFTFHVKMPIFVARQWVRHRTARLNEISGRYSVLKEECYLPADDDISLQSETNRQGRCEEAVSEDVCREAQNLFAEGQKHAFSGYQKMIDTGIARELARINLPLSTYTEMYWQIDLHNLLHFIRLRIHPHAQVEIRKYAEVLYDIVRRVCPLSCEAFEEHKRQGVTLSRREKEAVQALYAGEDLPLKGKEKQRFLEKMELPPEEG